MADVRRYNTVAMSLHWLIALLILTNIGLAWYFNTLHGLAKTPPLQIHKSIGITVLVLSLARLAWRFISPPPPLPASMPVWQRRVAHTAHALLYLIMIGMPLTGWAMSSASTLIRVYPITWFGLFQIPAIGPLTTLPPDQMKSAHHLYQGLHGLGAKLAYVLIAGHLLAALHHQFVRRDGVVWRMLPGGAA
jgi:cytochrome b561